MDGRVELALAWARSITIEGFVALLQNQLTQISAGKKKWFTVKNRSNLSTRPPHLYILRSCVLLIIRWKCLCFSSMAVNVERMNTTEGSDVEFARSEGFGYSYLHMEHVGKACCAHRNTSKVNMPLLGRTYVLSDELLQTHTHILWLRATRIWRRAETGKERNSCLDNGARQSTPQSMIHCQLKPFKMDPHWMWRWWGGSGVRC